MKSLLIGMVVTVPFMVLLAMFTEAMLIGISILLVGALFLMISFGIGELFLDWQRERRWR
jgi:hypothetical protein